MDNGLIFPYRRMNDHAEANDAKLASFLATFGLRVVEWVTLNCV